MPESVVFDKFIDASGVTVDDKGTTLKSRLDDPPETQTLTMESNFTTASNPLHYKFGKFCAVKLVTLKAAVNASGWTNVCKLPYVPSNTWQFPMVYEYSSNTYYTGEARCADVNGEGWLQIYKPVKDKTYWGSAWYLIE